MATMAEELPEPPINSNLLSTQRALIDTVCSFLTVATHHLLYLRRVYPTISFLAARAYNYPVRQNRHPDVCAWVDDAIAAVRNQLKKNAVETVAVCFFECETYQVLERWSFDLSSFPVVLKEDRDIPFDSIDDDALRKTVNVTDLEASFRAIFSRINTVAGKLQPLPDGDGAPECSFTMTIEVKEDADRPVGRLKKDERAWVPVEPEPFRRSRDASNGQTSDPAIDVQNKTYPVRRLEAGELRLEMFVEEAEAKHKYPTKHKSTKEKAALLSYGAGTEKFDPEYGYELEQPDINKKPNGGAFTDYQR